VYCEHCSDKDEVVLGEVAAEVPGSVPEDSRPDRVHAESRRLPCTGVFASAKEQVRHQAFDYFDARRQYYMVHSSPLKYL